MGVAPMPATKKITKKLAKKVSTAKAKRTIKKAASAKATTKSVAKRAAKKSTGAKKPATPTMSIDFQPGTDMYTAFEEMQKGGASRTDVSQRLAEMWSDVKTRNGNTKPVSTIMNHVSRRAKANGWTIEQTWKLVPPAESDVTKAAKKIAVAGTPKVRKSIVKKTTKKATKALKKR
jgi:hypothetical protein